MSGTAQDALCRGFSCAILRLIPAAARDYIPVSLTLPVEIICNAAPEASKLVFCVSGTFEARLFSAGAQPTLYPVQASTAGPADLLRPGAGGQ